MLTKFPLPTAAGGVCSAPMPAMGTGCCPPEQSPAHTTHPLRCPTASPPAQGPSQGSPGTTRTLQTLSLPVSALGSPGATPAQPHCWRPPATDAALQLPLFIFNQNGAFLAEKRPYSQLTPCNLNGRRLLLFFLKKSGSFHVSTYKKPKRGRPFLEMKALWSTGRLRRLQPK